MFLTSCFMTGAISDVSRGHVALSYSIVMELKPSANHFYEGVLQTDTDRNFILTLTSGKTG